MKIISVAPLFLSFAAVSAKTEAGFQRLLRNNPDPDFLDNDDLPPGLQNNPGQGIGVPFKEGRDPKAQPVSILCKSLSSKIRKQRSSLVIVLCGLSQVCFPVL